jgi:ABC-type polysaccharide/polyol phosphate transport system ATPase subunit
MTSPSINAYSASIHYPIVLTGAQHSMFAGMANKVSGGRVARSANSVQYVRGLTNVSLSIKSGDRIGLIGRNGAGKSTLLKMLAGILPPTSGRMETVGKTTNILSLGAGMDGDLTGYENIERMSRLLDIPKEKWADIREEVAEFTELGQFLGLPLRAYSAGMNLRLGFAMATAYPRDILVIDEVIGAGDMFFQNKATQRIREYTEQARILVIASHSFSTLEGFCNRAIWLDGGRIMADGDIRDVWEAYNASGQN